MRLDPKNRKIDILAAALRVAERQGGWSQLTRQLVAAEAECAASLVSKYFGTMTEFRRSIMRAAIDVQNFSVIGQGIATGDKHAMKVDDLTARKALASLTA